VCNREIYMTPVGTWSSRSHLLGSVATQSTLAPAHGPTRPVISYRC
jgi:hypothetical protein